ncbi:hypothetical protein D3C80_1925920 [compost metagenome]
MEGANDFKRVIMRNVIAPKLEDLANFFREILLGLNSEGHHGEVREIDAQVMP